LQSAVKYVNDFFAKDNLIHLLVLGGTIWAFLKGLLTTAPGYIFACCKAVIKAYVDMHYFVLSELHANGVR